MDSPVARKFLDPDGTNSSCAPLCVGSFTLLSASVSNPTGAAINTCLAEGGKMGALMRDHDWSRSRLGTVDAWPQSLKAAVSTCLQSRCGIILWWGPDAVLIYNDDAI